MSPLVVFKTRLESAIPESLVSRQLIDSDAYPLFITGRGCSLVIEGNCIVLVLRIH